MDAAEPSGHDRVLRALNFQAPDRVPRFDKFWPEFIRGWIERKGLPAEADPVTHYGIDMVVVASEESPWPSKAGIIRTEGGETVHRTGWGATHRLVDGGMFFLEMGTELSGRPDPAEPRRYKRGRTALVGL